MEVATWEADMEAADTAVAEMGVVVSVVTEEWVVWEEIWEVVASAPTKEEVSLLFIF